MTETKPDSQADWPTIRARVAERFDAHRTKLFITGVRGTNFMTPDYLATVLVGGEAVEITTGQGFCGERIFGVTWSRLPNGDVDPRDTVAFSLDEVAQAVGLP